MIKFEKCFIDSYKPANDIFDGIFVDGKDTEVGDAEFVKGMVGCIVC